jgi:hypothetical protein
MGARATVQNVTVTDDTLMFDLADGRSVSVPLAWYPRLWHGEQDEDISVENVLRGKPSGESQRSLKRWLEGRSR